MHYARKIHDPLFSKALAIQQEGITLLIIVVDICIMDTLFMNQVKAQITEHTGIANEQILLASNHNHASGDIVGLLGGAADLDYRLALQPLIVASGIEAYNNLQPAKMAYGKASAPEYVVCRRYKMAEQYQPLNPVLGTTDLVKTNPKGLEQYILAPESTPDPDCCFVGFKDLNNNWLAVLANYGLHYAADWPEDTITADYFGAYARHLKDTLAAGDNFVALMSNGTSGDVNIWDFMYPNRLPNEDFAKTELIGASLAKLTQKGLENATWSETNTLNYCLEQKKFSLRKPSKKELEKATKNLEKQSLNNLHSDPAFIHKIYDREQVLLDKMPDQKTLAIQSFKIGDVYIGALPGEFFAETGLTLKAELSDSFYFSINLCNSYGGYIPPQTQLEKGGYETWRARSSCMEVATEQTVRNTILQQVKAMK
jgi:neutral ceramidase